MRILVIADIHGKFEVLHRIIEDVEKEEYDLIVSQGDFTDMFDNKGEFKSMTIADVVLQKLMIPKKPLLCVPGNHDPYEIVDLLEDYGINIHNRRKKITGITFVGWGGAATPFNTNFEPTEEETEEALGDLIKVLEEEWILVSHSTPRGTPLDIVRGKKHVGSEAIRKVIEKNKPLLALTAHIHENRGEFEIGNTKVFYPGPAYDGFYGFVNIENGKPSCEMRKIPS